MNSSSKLKTDCRYCSVVVRSNCRTIFDCDSSKYAWKRTLVFATIYIDRNSCTKQSALGEKNLLWVLYANALYLCWRECGFRTDRRQRWHMQAHFSWNQIYRQMRNYFQWSLSSGITLSRHLLWCIRILCCDDLEFKFAHKKCFCTAHLPH